LFWMISLNLLTCELLSVRAAVGPSTRALTDVPQPSVARAGEFLVGVRAAGVNPVDYTTLRRCPEEELKNGQLRSILTDYHRLRSRCTRTIPLRDTSQ
jgi:hypothetical protein